MAFDVRDFLRQPDDMAAVAQLLTLAGEEPVRHEELLSGMPEGAAAVRLVAEDEACRILGVGWALRYPEEAAGQFSTKVVVWPDCRGRGIGTALLEALCQRTQAERLKTTVRDDDPASLAWATRRGYVIERHRFDSSLDLATFDESPFLDLIERLEREGIRFFAMADGATPAMEQALYEADREAAADDPGFDLESWYPFDQWRGYVLAYKTRPLDCLIVAADGDRVAGFTIMDEVPDSNSLWSNFTAVVRDYRGRGIATAIKVLAIRAGKRRGATHFITGNDSTNAPILAINRKLGYVPRAGIYTLRKQAAG